MKIIASLDHPLFAGPIGFLGSLGAFLQQIFALRHGREVDSAALSPRDAVLVEYIKSEPVLRTWVSALSGRSPRVQRALLIRAADVLDRETSQRTARSALARLAEPTLLQVVLAAIEAEPSSSSVQGVADYSECA